MITKLKNNNSGITIIALIVTIIVLLIIASITIATLTGDNGILSKGRSSKVGADISQYQEELEILRQHLYQNSNNVSGQ